jgi:SAM-dependent methyltransferase
MKVSRKFSLFVQYVLDELVPPVVRDSRLFMSVPMRAVLKSHANEYMGFKDSVFGLSEGEFGELYRRTSSAEALQGETDLNTECVDAILHAIKGDSSVLDVGCGRGYLSGRMAGNGHRVSACDVVLDEAVMSRFPAVTFERANIEALPYADNQFDVVVSTHTLEHVQNLPGAIAELRRVAKKHLVVVVPRQRPYKYAFNLHTQFFPYEWSIESAFGYRPSASIRRLGDWFYEESDPQP